MNATASPAHAAGMNDGEFLKRRRAYWHAASKKVPMDTHPLWTDLRFMPQYPELEENLEVDVLIIGGGITGVSTAHLLSNCGLSVVLVERGRLGEGDTSHTTAHLTYMTDTRLSDLLSVCGREKTRIAWKAGRAAIEHIQSTSGALDHDVGLTRVPGYLVASGRQDLERERDRLFKEAAEARDMGFDVTPVQSVLPSGAPGIRFEGQMKFHPLKYISGIASLAADRGVRIFEHTNVTSFGGEPDNVMANGHRIVFQKVIVATHVPLQGMRGTWRAALFQTKLASYSTYALAARIPKGLLPEMIWSNTEEPFHYLRVDAGEAEDTVIFGGEDHKTGVVADTAACYSRLEEKLGTLVPVSTVTHRWCGQVVETVDGLPYIGENASGQFIATGFSGNGLTFGVAAAIMAADWVEDRRNPWEDCFSPTRVELAALPRYVAENKDFPYHMVKDRLGIPKDAVPPRGEGIVSEINGEKVAVYCAPDGEIHSCSAICPHLGGIVVWNPAELTWDCPCHGSRFTHDGDLIAGPAEKGLEPVGQEIT